MPDFNVNSKMFVDDPMVHSTTLFNDGLALAEKDEYEKALSVFEQYRKYHPEDPKTYYELACCNYSLQKYDSALELVDKAIAKNEEYGEACRLKGFILIENREYGNAIPFFEYSNAIMPDDELTLTGLLRAYFLSRLFKSALVCVNKILDKRPNQKELRVYEAGIYARLGQFEKAISIAEELVIADPGDERHAEQLDLYKCMKEEQDLNRYPGMNN